MGGMKNLEITVSDYLGGALMPVDILNLAELLSETGVPEGLDGIAREAVERLAYIGRYIDEPQRDAAVDLTEMLLAGQPRQMTLKTGHPVHYAETKTGYTFVADRTASRYTLRLYKRIEWHRETGEIVCFSPAGPLVQKNWKWTGIRTLTQARRCARELLS
ncbi:hypothetical protein [Streptodolium elevatio]|uniref:Uncharacterized protein n=1 Tax=Streptodolium elevatio TaxID=3157996 RepID=A0ABV3DBY3_9ACTN